MAASVGDLVVCCSVLFWVLLSPTTLQVTAAPFSKNAGIAQSNTRIDASDAIGNLDRNFIRQRRKKRYKDYPVADYPGGYNKNSERLRDWDNKQFPDDYSRNRVGPRFPYDRSGYRGSPQEGSFRDENSYHKDPRYEEFKKTLEQRRPNYIRRIQAPQKKLDTGSNAIYQPERIGVPSHVAGFWGDSPNGAATTLKEKGILQTLAKAERSRYHKLKPSGERKVSTQYDFTANEILHKDDGYSEEKGKSEYGRQKGGDQTNNPDVPYQGLQSQYRPPNELQGSNNYPSIGNMLDQSKNGLKEGAPMDGMLLNLHQAPALVPVPKAHKPEAAAIEAPPQGSPQQVISTGAAHNANGTSKKEGHVEIPMPPRSKTWVEAHRSTTAAPTAAPTTTKLAIPMPPMSKGWKEQQKLKAELQHMQEEEQEVERLEEVEHLLELERNATSGTSGGNPSRDIAVEDPPELGRQGGGGDAGGAAGADRVYLTREEYQLLQHRAQLALKQESMLEEQREQGAHLPTESQVEEQRERESRHPGESQLEEGSERESESQVGEDSEEESQSEKEEERKEESQSQEEDGTDPVQEERHSKGVNKTGDGPESKEMDPTPEDIVKLRQAELERERQLMLEELEAEKSEIAAESTTSTVSPAGVTPNNTGSKNESLKQEERADTRQAELEKEREEMLQELEEEEDVDAGDDQNETKMEEQKEDQGLRAMAEAWEKSNSGKQRKRRAVPDRYPDPPAANNRNPASRDMGKHAGETDTKGVGPNNDIYVNGEKIAMPAKRGNSYKKTAGKFKSFPVHAVKTKRLGVPKSVAGFWEDTKQDDDIAAVKKPSGSKKHMKVTLKNANTHKSKGGEPNTLRSKLRQSKETNFYKAKGIKRVGGLSTYKKTPFEDDISPAGRKSPFKEIPRPEPKPVPLPHKYPVPPAQSSLAIKVNHDTSKNVAPEKIVSLESGVDNVPVPLKRQKVVIHNSVPHPSPIQQEYTTDQILAEKERLLENTLSQRVALAKSHSVNHYQADKASLQTNQLLKSSEKPANESASSSNETDISYQFFNPEFYNSIMARYKSRDALWAAVCLAIVLFVMFAAVWYSKMWRKKGGDWDIPGKYQPEATSIPIKELIRQKLGRIPRLKMKLKRKRKGPIGHRYLQLKRKQSTGATSSDDEVTYKRL